MSEFGDAGVGVVDYAGGGGELETAVAEVEEGPVVTVWGVGWGEGGGGGSGVWVLV